MPPENVSRLVCPKCGNDLSKGKIRYVETIQNHRDVLDARDGHLLVEGLYETGEGYDDGENPQFECHGNGAPGGFCGHRWPVPPWVQSQVDWV